MTDITIPREALEAGHHAYYSEATTLEAAFLAMIEAWPGMKMTPYWEHMTHKRHVEMILPLPKEPSNG